MKDRQARLLRVSQSMVRNLGLADAGDLVGKSDVDLFGMDFGHRTYIARWRDVLVQPGADTIAPAPAIPAM